MSPSRQGWIGVDLDGTLAFSHCNWRSNWRNIGNPIAPMLVLVKELLAQGEDVRIFTARLDGNWYEGKVYPVEEIKKHIEDWCLLHVGQILPVTNVKDTYMKLLYDDRAVGVERNTGRLIL